MSSFQVLRTVTEGAAAEVLLVSAAGPEHRFLVERLRAEHMHAMPSEEAFRAEVRDRMRLDHPHLLSRQHSFLWAEGRPAVLSERLPNENLAVLLRRHGRLSPDEVVRITAPLCEALDFLHSKGLVHADLRPAHVYLDGLGADLKPKLFDTGFALLRSSLLQPTQTHGLVPAEYLAPERISGRRADARSDVYGLGLLMFKMLTGSPPFISPDNEETRRLILEGKVPRTPPGAATLRPILLKCLATNPADRYPSAAFLRQALMNLAGEVTPARPLWVSEATDIKTRAITTPVDGEKSGGGTARIGPYELLHVIGEGGMGRVYRARHRSGRLVAIKVLQGEHAKNADALERFFLEAERLNAMGHEGIVHIHDYGTAREEEGGLPYLVMELLRGQSLKLHARRRPLPQRRMLELMLQAARALGAAHRLGIVHLDVKPDNLFIAETRGTNGGRGKAEVLKVLDFGVSGLIGQSSSSGDSKAVDHAALGTPAYMSPEQAAGGVLDVRADVYALGVVMYFLLAGHPPFVGATVEEVLARIVEEDVPALPEVSVAEEVIATDVVALILKCLRKNPDDRYASMQELGDAIHFLLRDNTELDADSTTTAGQPVVDGTLPRA